MDYKVLLKKDLETGWFVAEVPSLPGCISQGKTKKDALENIKDAVMGYIESLKKHPEEKIFSNNVEIEAISI
tara:strand:- start:8948 stop:9163 length:216 start_codon:yes stop_codon:yes gene_type:complete